MILLILKMDGYSNMTRINLVKPSELVDQHLMAEYREITRVSKLARPLKDYGFYKMSKGHVLFFYDKGLFLQKRTEELYQECIKRGFNVQYKAYKPHPKGLNNDWTPSEKDIEVSKQRIKEKLLMKLNFYKYCGVSIMEMPDEKYAQV